MAQIQARCASEWIGRLLIYSLARRACNIAPILVVFSIVLGKESDFERDVAPLIVQRCLECHSSIDPSGGLDLTNYKTLMRGGDSGLAIDSTGESSLLLKRLVSGEMPPEKNGKSQALSELEMAVFQSWTASGAQWPDGRVLDPFERTTAKRAGRDWWVWQPIKRPLLGSISNSSNSIDQFIQQKLTEQQLNLAPQRIVVRCCGG